MESYIIAIDSSNIDKRIQEARTILSDRKLLLDLSKNDLMSSREPFDMVYYYHFVRGQTIKWIAGMMGYSERQICRMISAIKATLSTPEKEEQNV